MGYTDCMMTAHALVSLRRDVLNTKLPNGDTCWAHLKAGPQHKAFAAFLDEVTGDVISQKVPEVLKKFGSGTYKYAVKKGKVTTTHTLLHTLPYWCSSYDETGFADRMRGAAISLQKELEGLKKKDMIQKQPSNNLMTTTTREVPPLSVHLPTTTTTTTRMEKAKAEQKNAVVAVMERANAAILQLLPCRKTEKRDDALTVAISAMGEFRIKGDKLSRETTSALNFLYNSFVQNPIPTTSSSSLKYLIEEEQLPPTAPQALNPVA